MALRYWRALPVAAKRYILYHCLVTPLLFTWYVVPYLMLESGLSVEESGLLFTAGSAVSSLLNFAVGRWLDRGCPNTVMAVISVMDSASYALYYLAFTTRSPIWVLVGVAVEELSFGLYPVYAVYEYLAYPAEVREKAYVYHNVLPLASQAVTYPLIGYLLGVALPTWEASVYALLAASILSLLYTLLPLHWLPRLGGEERPREEVAARGGIPRGFYPVALVPIMIGMASSIAPPLILVNLFREVLGGGLFEVSLYEALSAVTVVAISLPLLLVSKERGRLMVVIGLALSSASSLMLALARSLPVALASAVLASAGYAIMDPFFMDALFSKIPEELRGTLLGGIAGVRRIITIASPAIAGVLAERLAPQAPYIVSAALETLSIPLFLWGTRPSRDSQA